MSPDAGHGRVRERRVGAGVRAPPRSPSLSGRGPALTLGPSAGTRGSFHVVVRLLWSTKKGQPVCGSTLISQPGGSGSRSAAALPDAICTTGEWAAALMPGAGSRASGRTVAERAAAGAGALRAADVSWTPAPGTFMN